VLGIAYLTGDEHSLDAICPLPVEAGVITRATVPLATWTTEPECAPILTRAQLVAMSSVPPI
jgi:hypothetical protein